MINKKRQKKIEISRLEKIIKRTYNPAIGLLENALYLIGLYALYKSSGNQELSSYNILYLLPIATYATSDGISRMFFNTPLYRLKSDIIQNETNNPNKESC